MVAQSNAPFKSAPDPVPASTAMAPRRGLSANLHSIFGAAKKEWTILIRYPTWILSVLVWPILFPAASIFAAWALSGPEGEGLAHFVTRTGTAETVAYLVIGNAVWMWLNMMLWSVGTFLRQEQMRGTLESTWLTPALRIHILIGSSLAQLVVSIIFMLVTGVEVWLFFGTRLLGNPLPLLLVFILTIPSIYGMGIAFASVVMRFKESWALVHLVRGIIMVFVGVTHPIGVLPQWMQTVAKALPFTYTIEGLRRAVLTSTPFNQFGDVFLPLALFALVLPFVGWLCFSWMERYTYRKGGLSHY